MKFGKHLQKNVYPLWQSYYLSYKALKRIINCYKNASANRRDMVKTDCSVQFFFNLDRQLEKVNEFFETKKESYDSKYSLLLAKKEILERELASDTNPFIEALQRTDSLLSLLESLNSLLESTERMQNFIDINLQGFGKILKKYDKNFNAETKDQYFEDRIQTLPIGVHEAYFEHLSQKIRAQLKEMEKMKTKAASRKSLLPSVREMYLSVLSDNSRMMSNLLASTNKEELPVLVPPLILRSCRVGSLECLKVMMEVDGVKELEIVDIKERTPLHIATSANLPEVVKVLIDSGYSTDVKDIEGHSPMHTACQNGFTDCVEELLKGGAKVMVIDNENLTPMFCAVVRGHTGCVAKIAPIYGKEIDKELYEGNASFVSLACRYGHLGVLKCLLRENANVNHMDDDREHPLHLCIRSNSLECMTLLLENNAMINSQDMYGSTPLAFAANEGKSNFVEVLLNHKASVRVKDNNGMDPISVAIFHGHISVAEKMKHFLSQELDQSKEKRHYKPDDGWVFLPIEDGIEMDMEQLTFSDGLSNELQAKKNAKKNMFVEPGYAPRMYGHFYLQSHSQLRLKLGTESEMHPAIELLGREYVNNLALVVSPYKDAVDSTSSSPSLDKITVQLPVRDDNSRLTFFVDNLEETGVYFSVLTKISEEVIGKGVILPGSFSREGKYKDCSLMRIPLFSNELKVVGKLNLSYLAITPLKYPNMKIGNDSIYWKSTKTLPIIGHRGSGAREEVKAGSRKTHVEENTLLSFVTAASLGAQYIEFDVQLSQDGEPVIYHDFNIHEFGCDIPVDRVSLNNFKNVKNTKPKMERGNSKMPRSKSLEGSPIIDLPSRELSDSDVKKKKPSELGIVDAPFATLKETFSTVPPDTGFNIEVKYPTFEEMKDENLDPAFSINTFVDNVLKCVFDNADGRPIMFSSFHPEVCINLSLKQPNYPVFFLNASGKDHYNSDTRLNSVKEAASFAKRNQLLGLVCDVGPLLDAPDIIKTVKTSGLLLFTYGKENNDPDLVKLQLRCGVDAVIVDHVAHVSKNLKEKVNVNVATAEAADS
eukprot:Nk52_evm7s156 gene=Nk52_evmTU7s156